MVQLITLNQSDVEQSLWQCFIYDAKLARLRSGKDTSKTQPVHCSTTRMGTRYYITSHSSDENDITVEQYPKSAILDHFTFIPVDSEIKKLLRRNHIPFESVWTMNYFNKEQRCIIKVYSKSDAYDARKAFRASSLFGRNYSKEEGGTNYTTEIIWEI